MNLTVLEPVKREWEQHQAMWGGCVRCAIGKKARYHVFARGTLPCDVLFVGEAPGETEDLVGKPFVGRSGRLLDGWITFSIEGEYDRAGPDSNWARMPIGFSYAVTNTVLCRPTTPENGNRPPTGVEMANCNQRLIEFVIKIARPKLIVTLGKVAKRQMPIWSMPILNLAHPSWVLRQGGKGSNADNQQKESLCQFLQKNRSLLNQLESPTSGSKVFRPPSGSSGAMVLPPAS